MLHYPFPIAYSQVPVYVCVSVTPRSLIFTRNHTKQMSPFTLLMQFKYICAQLAPSIKSESLKVCALIVNWKMIPTDSRFG